MLQSGFELVVWLSLQAGRHGQVVEQPLTDQNCEGVDLTVPGRG
ncbi:Uncharacterised protein [Mycobacterium tuberculosis]|nr:Uncharacterised protein [Mycobacterium tuberculosis]